MAAAVNDFRRQFFSSSPDACAVSHSPADAYHIYNHFSSFFSFVLKVLEQNFSSFLKGKKRT
jgi:hypothetical protein